VGLLIALGTALTQPRLIPEALSGSPMLMAPAIAVAAAMIYWLLRVRFPKAFEALRPAIKRLAARLAARQPTRGRAISPAATRVAAPR